MLTQPQRAMFDYLRAEIARTGHAPTYREMAKAFEIGATSARSLVQGMEKRGFVRRIPGAHRGLEILRDPVREAA